MSEASPHDATSGRGLPQPTFFDPSFERLPAPVSGDTAQPGPVLLLYDRGADRDWLADAAVALATGWHASGRRTVLADLSLDEPLLSGRIGVPNQDGVVDIFLYGASLARSARPVPGRGFYLISTGTYEPDSAAILRNPRWPKIVQGFREAGAALLLFVPADAEGVDALTELADESILLGRPGSGIAAAAVGQPAVRAWLAPPGAAAGTGAARAAAPAAAGSPFPEPEARRPGVVPAPAEPRPAPRATATVDQPSQEAIPVPEPGWEKEPEAPRRRRASPLLWVLLAVAILAGAAYAVLTYYPDLLGGGSPAAVLGGGATEGPRRAADAVPAGSTLPYSVAIIAYDEWAPAQREVETYSRRFPETTFFIIPEERGDRLWYKVFAGMLADSAEVHDLRDRLVAAGIDPDGDTFGEWDLIQYRPLTFELGEYETPEVARSHAEAMVRRQVPAYVAPVPFSDGTERWKVYGAAFADSADAEPMRRVVAGAGIEPRLVEREGRPSAVPK
jgi:hypothetical protein